MLFRSVPTTVAVLEGVASVNGTAGGSIVGVAHSVTSGTTAGAATAFGVLLAEAYTIESGSPSGAVAIEGQVFANTGSLVPGAANGGATAYNEYSSVDTTILAGSAVGGAIVDGVLVDASLSLTVGTASGGSVCPVEATDRLLIVANVILPGVAVGISVPAFEPPHIAALTLGRTDVSWRRLRRDGNAAGSVLIVGINLAIDGLATGAANAEPAKMLVRFELFKDAVAPGSTISRSVELVAGAATGFDAIAHDNDFVLMAA